MAAGRAAGGERAAGGGAARRGSGLQPRVAPRLQPCPSAEQQWRCKRSTSMLYVPAGKWLTGPFNLTSHFTLFLHSDAVILASELRAGSIQLR